MSKRRLIRAEDFEAIKKASSKKNLNRMLKYKNPEIIARFCKDFGVTKKEANTIFKDMIRFLWLIPPRCRDL
jgi:hypothetical protein